MNRKKIFFATLFVFGISIASAQYVNDYNVNIRSEPSLDKNNKIGQLTKDDKISVYLVTNQTMKIGSSEYPWMYISAYETNLKGWIYGEYVSGLDSRGICYVDIKFAYRTNFFKQYMEKASESITDENDRLLNVSDFYDVKETAYPHFKEFCPQVGIQETSFGTAKLYFNRETKNYRPLNYNITKNDFCPVIGWTKKKVIEQFGSDFKDNGDSIYYYTYDYSSVNIVIYFKDDIVTLIQLSPAYT